MRKSDRISGIFFLLSGLGIVGFSSAIEVGSFASPGPGLFPLISGIILAGLSLVLLIQSFKPREDDLFYLSKGGYIRVFGLLASMLLYAGILDFFGFVIATFFLLLFFLKRISRFSWTRSLIYSAAISMIFYGIFNVLLDVGLPAGLTDIFKR